MSARVGVTLTASWQFRKYLSHRLTRQSHIDEFLLYLFPPNCAMAEDAHWLIIFNSGKMSMRETWLNKVRRNAGLHKERDVPAFVSLATCLWYVEWLKLIVNSMCSPWCRQLVSSTWKMFERVSTNPFLSVTSVTWIGLGEGREVFFPFYVLLEATTIY